METENKHGGKRENAGRPPAEKKYVTTLRVKEETATVIISEYGSLSAALDKLAAEKNLKNNP